MVLVGCFLGQQYSLTLKKKNLGCYMNTADVINADHTHILYIHSFEHLFKGRTFYIYIIMLSCQAVSRAQDPPG